VQQTSQSPPDPAQQSSRQDQIDLWVVIAVSLWMIFVSGALHIGAWFTEEVMLSVGITWPSWIWFLIALFQGFLIGIPAILVWKYRPSDRYGPVFLTWTLSALFVLILSPIRLVSPPASQLASLIQIFLVSVFLILVLVSWKLRSGSNLLRSFVSYPAILLGAGISAVVIYPWLAWGAPGSFLETALNLIAGLMFGVTVGLILANYLLVPIRQSSKRTGHDLILGGFAAGTTLFVMCSAFGMNGLQVLLMLFVPVLFITVVGTGWYGQTENAGSNWIGVALLIGIATAIPMILVDSDELVMTLAFGSKDIPYWTSRAAMVSIVIAIVANMAFILWRKKLAGTKASFPLSLFAGAAWILGVLLFVGVGQPGFYGDQIFVVMSDQADLGGIDFSVDASNHAELVYDALVDHAETSQADIREDLENLGIDYTPYYLVNGLAIDAGPTVGNMLERRPDVDRVIDNPILRPLPSPPGTGIGVDDAPSSPDWNLTMIGADRVWNELGISGEGVVIGHADSGVQGDHPALTQSYRGVESGDDYNWFDPWFESTSPTDSSGHGTHTLGIILGSGTGVAPGSQWFACANLVRNLGNTALYLDCLQFLFAPYPVGGDPFADGDPNLAANVINNSWLCPEIEGCDDNTLAEAAKYLREAGVFVVVSAGNEGPRCGSVQYPMATFDEVFSVGAIDEYGDLALFSSLGPVDTDGTGRTKPDLVAPGDGILSAFPSSTYSIQSGTSMAAPHIAGVVALMWSANPSLIGEIDQTELILAQTATHYSGSFPTCINRDSTPNNAVGYGIVNAYDAVMAALEYTPDAGLSKDGTD